MEGGANGEKERVLRVGLARRSDLETEIAARGGGKGTALPAFPPPWERKASFLVEISAGANS